MIGIDKASRMITQLLTLARIEPNNQQIQAQLIWSILFKVHLR
jgi:two-component system sensor histidine kinase QseC